MMKNKDKQWQLSQYFELELGIVLVSYILHVASRGAQTLHFLSDDTNCIHPACVLDQESQCEMQYSNRGMGWIHLWHECHYQKTWVWVSMYFWISFTLWLWHSILFTWKKARCLLLKVFHQKYSVGISTVLRDKDASMSDLIVTDTAFFLALYR